MNNNKPILTLNMNDKIYLAVAKNFTGPMSFVYTLACEKSEKSQQYDMFATPQIHAFQDKVAAGVYHDTIEQLVEINEGNEKYKMLFNCNDPQIKQFMEIQR